MYRQISQTLKDVLHHIESMGLTESRNQRRYIRLCALTPPLGNSHQNDYEDQVSHKRKYIAHENIPLGGISVRGG